MGHLKTVNLEQGMPTVQQAVIRLKGELERARAEGASAVKIIHGYGSSGTGGRLRTGLRVFLENLKESNKIRGFIPGEKFEIFNMDTIKAFDRCPELRGERDLGRFNNGITVILL